MPGQELWALNKLCFAVSGLMYWENLSRGQKRKLKETTKKIGCSQSDCRNAESRVIFQLLFRHFLVLMSCGRIYKKVKESLENLPTLFLFIFPVLTSLNLLVFTEA